MVSIPEPAHLRALADKCDEIGGRLETVTLAELDELWRECHRARCWCDRSGRGIATSVAMSLAATACELRTYANDIEASQ